MKKYKIGFIGCGNMAGAMIGGMVKNGVVAPDQVIASNHTTPKLDKIHAECGIDVTTDNVAVAKDADYVVLAVKPIFYREVIAQIKESLTPEQVIVTIAPGFTLEVLQELIGEKAKIIRTMPNTPALVGEGMTAMVRGAFVSDEEIAELERLFAGFGKTEWIPERLMDAVVAVSGSSPAYIFMLMEAMADAAVLEGMPRAQAYRFAAQAVLGSAKMLLDLQMHPGALKDMVCSPGGTTIEAVKVLEQKGMRAAVMDAMSACADKCKKL